MAGRLGEPDYARDGASVSGNRSPRVDERDPDPLGVEQMPYWEAVPPSRADRIVVRRPGILAPMNSDSQVVQRDGGRARTMQPQQAPKRSASLPPEEGRPRGSERATANPKATRSPRRKPAARERANRSTSREAPKRAAASTQRGEFETVYNSVDARDVTVHLELDVTEDFDEELEEFNRLGRLGDFRGAKKFFDKSLRSHVNNPAVFVQYAEMLLEMGDYRSISRLNADQVFSPVRHSTSKSNLRLRKLHLNWKLVQAVTLSCTQHELSPIWNELGPPVDSIFPMRKDVDSTDVSFFSDPTTILREISLYLLTYSPYASL